MSDKLSLVVSARYSSRLFGFIQSRSHSLLGIRNGSESIDSVQFEEIEGPGRESKVFVQLGKYVCVYICLDEVYLKETNYIFLK